jgi:hypothetical protein
MKTQLRNLPVASEMCIDGEEAGFGGKRRDFLGLRFERIP